MSSLNKCNPIQVDLMGAFTLFVFYSFFLKVNFNLYIVYCLCEGRY